MFTKILGNTNCDYANRCSGNADMTRCSHMRFCGDHGRLASVRGCCGSCSSQGISVAPKPGVQGARASTCSPIRMNGADKMRVASSGEGHSSK